MLGIFQKIFSSANQRRISAYEKVVKKINAIEEETIKQLSKLVSLRYESLIPTAKNTTISFTFADWALPFLKFLKKIGLAK